MLVSVVIPAYNAENWVAETIESVLEQTHSELEIIIVDDGSTDGTVAVAKRSLQHARIPYVILQQDNAGAAGARNRGWRVARGPWVQFLDADDLLEPAKIERQLETASVEQTADVIYSDWQKLVWKGAWEVAERRSPVIGEDPLPDVLSDKRFLHLSCLLFRATGLQAVAGFDKEHEPIEDVGLCVKIAIAGAKFVKAPSVSPMSFYRDVPRSFSKRDHRRFTESCIKNAKLAERYLRENGKNSSEIVNAIIEVYYMGARFFAGHDWERFEELVSDIEHLRPAFVPRVPMKLNFLSRMTGYRRAERLAVLYRRGKNLSTNLTRRDWSQRNKS